LADARSLASLANYRVDTLKAASPALARGLAAMGIVSILDLLTHYPRRYLDRSRISSIAELEVGQEAVFLARVARVERRQARSRRSIVEVTFADARFGIRAIFFNQPWRAAQLVVGTEVAVAGRVELFRGRPQLTNPLVDLIGDQTGRIIPLYPASPKAGVTSVQVGRCIEEALDRAGQFYDPVSRQFRQDNNLVSRTLALSGIHRPEHLSETVAARRRLAFDELLRIQVALRQSQRKIFAGRPGRAVVRPPGRSDLVGQVLAGLAYELTDDQASALAEIRSDMAESRPMHRLLQGDVGSGKTIVAVLALIEVVSAGFQGALMAPTEILAEQHHASLVKLVQEVRVEDPRVLGGERPLRADLLSSSLKAAERRAVLDGLASGRTDLVVGTHSLLSDDVVIPKLNLVVVDEQHRFGVEQRARLRAKGGGGTTVAHLLVMTATPIPRTAAMTIFGDLDLTLIKELPPGRSPVRTTLMARGREAEAMEVVRREVSAGHQAYVVCPLVEESIRSEMAGATAEFERLARGPLEGLRLGLLHGQMTSADKESVMAGFRSGQIEVLVATVVIEVGVDVPNATVMVVEDAQQFGLAQLHQLRGRVGRGALDSTCILIADTDSPEAQERLRALTVTNDGFELAEIDLRLRGQGTVLGTAQAGLGDLRLASLIEDGDLIEAARRMVRELDLDGVAGQELVREVEQMLAGAAEFVTKS
jgi:ATP-dependent DNA helicase RecG